MGCLLRFLLVGAGFAALLYVGVHAYTSTPLPL